MSDIKRQKKNRHPGGSRDPDLIFMGQLDDAPTVIGGLENPGGQEPNRLKQTVLRLLRNTQSHGSGDQAVVGTTTHREVRRDRTREEVIAELQNGGYKIYTVLENIESITLGRQNFEGQPQPTFIVDNNLFSKGPQIVIERLDFERWQLTHNGTQRLVFRRSEGEMLHRLKPGDTVEVGFGAILGTNWSDVVLEKCKFYPFEQELVVGIKGK